MNLNDPKIVVAIENAVCDQLEASGITADPFRLDGEKIVDAILEQLGDFVLVPKSKSESFSEELDGYLKDLWLSGNAFEDGFVDVTEINHNKIWSLVIKAQEQK